MSAKTWSNIRSTVSGAIQRYCGPSKRTDLPRNLSPAWLEQRNLLSRHGTDRLMRGLSAFIHFCNRAGIEPDQVGDDAAVRFLEHKRTATACRNPEDRHRETCRLWNKTVDQVPGWSSVKLKVPDYRKRISLDWAALPPAFVADLNRWCEAAGKRAPGFEETGARSLASTTVATRREQMRRLASMMLKAGMPAGELQSLADLCRIERLRAGLTLYAEHLGSKEAPSLSETMAGLIALAKIDLRLPLETITALKKLKRLTGSHNVA
jgi:hypothetical protein